MKIIIENSYYELGDIRNITEIEFVDLKDRFENQDNELKGCVYDEEIVTMEKAYFGRFKILFYNNIPPLDIVSISDIKEFIDDHKKLIELWSSNQTQYLKFF